ncbi:MAG: carbohydrate binding domain-containing protein, partial [Paludibacter sp.]
YFAKGGFSADPTWKGLIHKISMYNTSLTDENVVYLYQHGAEDNAVITPSVSTLAFDPNYPAKMITVTGSNLSSDITITAPAGITVQPSTLSANSLNADLTFIYDGTTPVDGVVTLTSGTTVIEIPVKCVSDATCYVPLYSDFINLINDPGLNNVAAFTGWGPREAVNVVSDPANVYCGASSIKVGDGEKGGSLDFKLDGLLYPNTTYRVKFVAKTEGTFNLGIERIDLKNSANNVILKQFNTNGEWQTFDYFFATGDEVANDPVIYLNAFNLDGKIGYFDNWELYASPEQIILPTIRSLVFDAQYIEGSFAVTAGNLNADIVITAPAGITVEPSTLPAGAASALVTVTYDGTTAVDGNITMTSGTATASVYAKSGGDNTTCFTPLYTDRPNLIPDPYFNSMSNFGGWERRSLISILENPDTVYCGSHSGKIDQRGDFEVVLTDKLVPRNTYISRAMILTKGGAFKMGINNHDMAFSGDFTDSVNTDGVWQEFTFEFNTGDSLKTASPVIFFNNDGVTGKIAFIDNWELYKKDTITAIINVKDNFENLYVQNNKIVAEFDLDNSSSVELSVYNVQGSLILNNKMVGIAGRNKKVVDANFASGIYIVKLTLNNKSSYRKLIK